MSRLLLAAAIVSGGAALAGCPGASAPVDPSRPASDRPRPRIVAHRGASAEMPENTMAAFRRAWDLGVEGIELDVRLSSDGQVVVIHDATTARTAGVDKAVDAQTLAELLALDAGAWKGPRFAGERIPTLVEVLASVPKGGTVFVELKSAVETAPAVAQVIRDADPARTGGHVALQAYDPFALAALASALPGVPAYWTIDAPTDAAGAPTYYPTTIIDDAVGRRFAGLALDVRGVDEAFLSAAKSAGLLVDVWTLNSAPLITEWLGQDVRWIETDKPELAPSQK
jgi:glycerophosphoryl diester phosphodiesterase